MLYLETPYGYIHFVSSRGKNGYRPEKEIEEERLLMWATAEDCEAWAKNNNYEVVGIHQWLRHD